MLVVGGGIDPSYRLKDTDDDYRLNDTDDEYRLKDTDDDYRLKDTDDEYRLKDTGITHTFDFPHSVFWDCTLICYLLMLWV